MSRPTGRVKGKTAVVTGAGSGIGRALALELARRGARVAVSDVNRAGLDGTEAALRAAGAEVHAAPLDVSDRAAVRAYAAQVVGHFGTVHQLYNNAGVADAVGATAEVDYAAFERLLAINLWGVIQGSKEFLPHLIASGDGHLVNISSLNGYMAQSGMAAYCTSKFGVRGFTESVRVEMQLAGHPVQVTCVHPGGVKTNIATAAMASARTAEEAAEGARRARIYNEQLFKTTPAAAAREIVDGVEAGKARVLVGLDAKLVDLAVRVLPALYTRVTVWWERRVFGDEKKPG
jgi:NAD(P)-dependent dehydrogenase (short-subunit alcohol dehydrogenase family)